MSGIGEILLLASNFSDDINCKLLAEYIGSYGIETYVETNSPWPSEVGKVTPGLMLGLSGIGNFYLHLCYPKLIFSPLTIMST